MSQAEQEEELNAAKIRTEVGFFDQFLEAIDPWADQDEGRIIATQDSIYTKIQDAAGVGMCLSRIKGKALNDIQVGGDEEIEVALNIVKPQDMLGTCSNSSEVEITFPVQVSSGSRYMKFDVIDEDIEYMEPLLDPDSVRAMPTADPISHETRIVVDGTELRKTIGRIDALTDSDETPTLFRTGGGLFEISISDKVDGRFSKKFRPSGPSEEIELDEHETRISSSYLNEISRTVGRGDEVEVHVRQDYPIRLDVNLDNDGDAKVIYILAPRLDSEP